MRYFVSDLDYPPKAGPWSETTETNERTFIETYFEDHLRFYDADNSGENVVYFAFSTGKFFKLHYEWWWARYHDDESDESGHYLDFIKTITEVTKDQTEGLCADRDWLSLLKTR